MNKHNPGGKPETLEVSCGDKPHTTSTMVDSKKQFNKHNPEGKAVVSWGASEKAHYSFTTAYIETRNS